MPTPDPTGADLLAEAATLIFPNFDEDQAWRLGNSLVAMSQRERLGVVINIRTANRTLFHAALPGSGPSNDNWARRKSNSCLMFQEASLLVGTRNRERHQTLADLGLDGADYADHGGAVPVVVRGVGMVAVVTVSGLPQRDDHALVVRAMREILSIPISVRPQ